MAAKAAEKETKATAKKQEKADKVAGKKVLPSIGKQGRSGQKGAATAGEPYHFLKRA